MVTRQIFWKSWGFIREQGEDNPVLRTQISIKQHHGYRFGQAYRQPLSIVGLARGEESAKRVVGGNGEAGEVRQELTTKVEDDKEEVQGHQADDSISLGDGCRLFEIVQSGVFGKLLFQISDKRRKSVRMQCAIGNGNKRHTSLSSWPIYC